MPAPPPIRDRLISARLPAVPQVLLKLLALCRSENTSIADFAKLVAKDAGLTGRVLSIANSAAHQRGGSRAGLEQALMILGVDTLKSLIIGESVAQVFNALAGRDTVGLVEFWRHSLTTAIVARDLASRLSYAHGEEAYLAGLLHDVGRLALLSAAPEEYRPRFAMIDDDQLCEIERAELQMTHAEAGAWLIERWKLDSFLADSVLYHHEPVRALDATHPLVRIVLLANRLAQAGPDSPAVAEACSVCGLSPLELEKVSEAAAGQVEIAAAQLGIDLGDSKQPTPANSCNAQLAEEVHQLVLTNELTRNLGRQRSDTQLLESLTRSARLLFDLEDALILLVSHGNRSLVGVPLGKHRQRLAEYSVPLVAGNSMADAVLKKTPLFLNRQALPVSIAEDQLMRVLDTDAAVVLPLATAQQTVGALVGAVRPWQIEALQRKSGFLEAFAAQGANAMLAALQERTEVAQRINGIADDYRTAAQKMVHEVNNPLTIIKNYLSVLDAKLARSEPVSGEVSILNEEIDRVGRIVKSITQVKPEASAGNMDANRVVRDVVRLFQETEFVPSNVRITTQFYEEPLPVAGDGNSLRQMLINLIKNGVEALAAGGELLVAVTGPINRGGQMYVELNVRDNGAGIPRDMLAHLFTEAKSSKGGDHQGLGLCIVGELATKLGGEVNCRSGRGGTTFSILLPARGQQRNGESNGGPPGSSGNVA